MILELLRQHKERTAALLVSKKASETFLLFSYVKNDLINRFFGILYDSKIVSYSDSR